MKFTAEVCCSNIRKPEPDTFENCVEWSKNKGKVTIRPVQGAE